MDILEFPGESASEFDRPLMQMGAIATLSGGGKMQRSLAFYREVSARQP